MLSSQGCMFWENPANLALLELLFIRASLPEGGIGLLPKFLQPPLRRVQQLLYKRWKNSKLRRSFVYPGIALQALPWWLNIIWFCRVSGWALLLQHCILKPVELDLVGIKLGEQGSAESALNFTVGIFSLCIYIEISRGGYSSSLISSPAWMSLWGSTKKRRNPTPEIVT